MKIKKKIPKQDRSQFMVDSILEAAARILEGKVPGGFTTNKIAEVAGVSVGSLYQYFKNKESVVEDILFKRLEENMNILFNDLQLDEKLTEVTFLETLVRSQFDLWDKRSELSKSILKWAPKVLDPSFLDKNEERLILYLKSKIQEYEFKDFRTENLDIALIMSINSVRISVYSYFVKEQKFDYETWVNETIIMLKSYLLKT